MMWAGEGFNKRFRYGTTVVPSIGLSAVDEGREGPYRSGTEKLGKVNWKLSGVAGKLDKLVVEGNRH